jgi:glycosyltransferase involved in cell wall biosynthesis
VAAHLRSSATSADKKSRASVSLTMIARNEASNIRNALASVAGLFDEIVIVDNGSTDRTREIAAELGAKVPEFPWTDDFSAARNAALDWATGDYAFWLDADDVIDPPERETPLRLLESLRVPGAAYVIRCACDPDQRGKGGSRRAGMVDQIRLVPPPAGYPLDAPRA